MNNNLLNAPAHSLPQYLVDLLKASGQSLPSVPQDMAQMVGVQPRVGQPGLNYEDIAGNIQDAAADARFDHAREVAPLALMGGTIPQMARLFAAGRGLGGMSSLNTAAVTAGLGANVPQKVEQADALRNMLTQRMQRGQSLPPGLLDQ